MLAVLPVFLPTKLMDVCEQAITRCFGRTATDIASTGRRRSRHRHHRHTPVLGIPRQATFLSTTGNVVAWILLMLGVTWNVLNHVPLQVRANAVGGTGLAHVPSAGTDLVLSLAWFQPVADYLNPVVSVVRVDQVQLLRCLLVCLTLTAVLTRLVSPREPCPGVEHVYAAAAS